MKKRIFCLLLILSTLFCLSACKKEEPEQPDDGFPTTVETIYPVVEGNRIPFQILFVNEGPISNSASVFRNAEEVQYSLTNRFKNALSSERQELLLSVDYTRYCVLNITINRGSNSMECKELIQKDGALIAVYSTSEDLCSKASDQQETSGDVFYSIITTVLLVRKDSFDFAQYRNHQEIEIETLQCCGQEDGCVEDIPPYSKYSTAS